MVLSHFVKKFETILMLILTTCYNISRIHELVHFFQTLLAATLYFPSVFRICLIEPTKNYQEQIIVLKPGMEAFNGILIFSPKLLKICQCLKKRGSVCKEHQGGHSV